MVATYCDLIIEEEDGVRDRGYCHLEDLAGVGGNELRGREGHCPQVDVDKALLTAGRRRGAARQFDLLGHVDVATRCWILRHT